MWSLLMLMLSQLDSIRRLWPFFPDELIQRAVNHPGVKIGDHDGAKVADLEYEANDNGVRAFKWVALLLIFSKEKMDETAKIYTFV